MLGNLYARKVFDVVGDDRPGSHDNCGRDYVLVVRVGQPKVPSTRSYQRIGRSIGSRSAPPQCEGVWIAVHIRATLDRAGTLAIAELVGEQVRSHIEGKTRTSPELPQIFGVASCGLR